MAARVAGPLTEWRRRREAAIALAAAGAVMAVCSLLPLLMLLGESAASLGQIAGQLTPARLGTLVARSTALSLSVTALAMGIGIPLGVVVGRTDAVARRPAALVHVFPVFLPPFLVALGWFHLFGARGLLGSEATSRVPFSGRCTWRRLRPASGGGSGGGSPA